MLFKYYVLFSIHDIFEAKTSVTSIKAIFLGLVLKYCANNWLGLYDIYGTVARSNINPKKYANSHDFDHLSGDSARYLSEQNQ